MAIPRLDQITSADWQPKLGELGAVVEGAEDVAQCIRIILMTPKGSVPHRPNFGSDLYQYLDWPLASARPHIIRAALDAIAIWEPRVEITAASVEQDEEDEATIRLTLTGRLVQGRELTSVVELAA